VRAGRAQAPDVPSRPSKPELVPPREVRVHRCNNRTTKWFSIRAPTNPISCNSCSLNSVFQNPLTEPTLRVSDITCASVWRTSLSLSVCPCFQIPHYKDTPLPMSVYLLHSLTHVELNAIDLAWDTIVRYSHMYPSLPIGKSSRDGKWVWCYVTPRTVLHY
jgi:hypothetical protein